MSTRQPRRRGQALVEFCLVFPLLLMFLLAIIDLAHLGFVKTSILSAAGAGARWAATSPRPSDDQVDRYVRASAPGVGLASDAVTVLWLGGEGGAQGEPRRVEVRVRALYRPLAGMLLPRAFGRLEVAGRAAAILPEEAREEGTP